MVGFIAFGIFGFIFRSGFFQVTTLEIIGDRGLLGERLIHALEGLKGKSIFGIRAWELEQAFKRIPGIKRARVEKVFPHTLLITLEERKPEIALEGRTGMVCLDEEGVEVPCQSQVVRVKGLEQYGSVSEREYLLREVLAIVTSWKSFFDYPLETIEVAGERLFILRLQNGIVIRCGGALNLRNKMHVLRPYLREVNIRSLRVFGFDLQAGNDIVIMTGEHQ